MLNNLTILIITYQRYSFLKRLLSFYLSYKTKAKFIVLDSSEDYPEDKELLRILSNENVTWKRYPSDIFFLKKISEGCKLITTDYVVLSADDDFLIPTSLEECLHFLLKNRDYSSVQGLSFTHNIYKKGQNLDLRLIPFHKGEALSLEHNSPCDRISSYMTKGKYYPMYSIHHISNFSSIWKESNKYVDGQGLSELLPCCLSLLRGKMKVLPNFYNLREPNNFHGWSDQETLSKIYSQKRIERASLGLANNLIEDKNFSTEEAGIFSEEVFRNYLNNLYKKQEEIAKSNTPVPKFISVLRQRLSIRSRITDPINKMFYQGSHPLIYPKYLLDFLKVKEVILNFNLSFEELNKARTKIDYP